MQLDGLVTKDNADSGVWEPVVIYGKQQDFDLCILGADSDAVQKYGRESLKKLKKLVGKNQDNGEFDDDTVDELTDSKDEAAIVRIAGIRGWKVEKIAFKEASRTPEPVVLGGVELKNDRKSYELLISKIPAIKDFVFKVSNDRTNFLSGRKKA